MLNIISAINDATLLVIPPRPLRGGGARIPWGDDVIAVNWVHLKWKTEREMVPQLTNFAHPWYYKKRTFTSPPILRLIGKLFLARANQLTFAVCPHYAMTIIHAPLPNAWQKFYPQRKYKVKESWWRKLKLAYMTLIHCLSICKFAENSNWITSLTPNAGLVGGIRTIA